ncbi:hypothetical protein WR25_02029 isoform G [Diploscapter pachys]|uniref:C2H2-type domain-containing protein n=1 Tax=Diploscapter pachys TaxID=2018661 RepID=A0A2A2K9M2_9BILA|nr:hypothetical protein WR25_02029 isoform E [Diploscapter pachys]PAV70612.1 hypothetical protein WR25_02029 isoform G [Diploscapter pachys]
MLFYKVTDQYSITIKWTFLSGSSVSAAPTPVPQQPAPAPSVAPAALQNPLVANLLQTQLLAQMLPMQGVNQLNPLLASLNPNNATLMYYNQLLQQQQQQTFLQALQQQQQTLQQHQSVAQQAQALQHQQQSQQVVASGHAFHPTASANVAMQIKPSNTPSSNPNMESQMNIQERLMSAYLNEQQQLRALEQQQSSAMAGSIGIAKREPERIVLSTVGIKREEPLSSNTTHLPVSGLSVSLPSTATAPAGNNSAASSSLQQQQPPVVESLDDRIQRLITQNEQVLQQEQAIVKRRPYHRQIGAQNSIDHESNSGGSTRTSPGPRDAAGRMLQAASRSQSLYEPLQGVRAFGGGSLTSGHPIVRSNQQNININHTPECIYCGLAFPNEAGLQVHQTRCDKKAEVDKAKAAEAAALAHQTVELPAAAAVEPSRHPLKRRLLGFINEEQQSSASSPSASGQQPIEHSLPKLPRKDSQNDIVVIEEKRMQRPDPDRLAAGLVRRKVADISTLNFVKNNGGRATMPAFMTMAEQSQVHQIDTTQNPNLVGISQQQSQTTNALAPMQHNLKEPTVAQSIQAAAAAVAAAQQQQQAGPSTQTLPPPASSTPLSVKHSPVASSFIPQTAPNSNIPVNIKREPFDLETIALDGNIDKPYWLVLSDAQKALIAENNSNRRNRGRNITSETFMCMHRAQPMFVEQKGNLSMYSNWHQVNINEAESKLNLLFMGMCSTKPRTGVHQFFRYTVANKDQGQYKMTHSSFWDLSNKLRQRKLEQQIKEEQDGEIKMEVGDTPVDEANQDILAIQPNGSLLGTADSFRDNNKAESENATTAEQQLQPQPQQQQGMNTTETNMAGKAPIVNREQKKTVKATRVENVIGGYRTDEVYVYVRGRGRGRYVCERCGIRCKKPSMLKKHIKSHTDVRPFKCTECNFSFKTKGNLTKHLSSKTHRRRLAHDDETSDNEDRLEIADEEHESDVAMHAYDPIDIDGNSSDEETDAVVNIVQQQAKALKKFGQEVILVERTAHTPPSRWVLVEEEGDRRWPAPESVIRNCSSAPPAPNFDIPHSPMDETPSYLVGTSQQQQASHNSTSHSSSLPTAIVTPQPHMQPFRAPVALQASQLPVGIASGVNLSTSFPGSAQMISVGDAVASSLALGKNGSASSIPTTQVAQYFFLNKEETFKCDLCDQSFHKESRLKYHRLTHSVNKNASRNKVLNCTECPWSTRAKGMLIRHLEISHNIHLDDTVAMAIDPMATAQSVLVGGASSIANNPRSFVCSDCNIGFRKHGILAKHLRSKTHVMKLETLKRLPEDTLSLITKKDNCQCLNDIDTTDCEKARESLLAIVQNIRAEFQRNGVCGTTPNTSALSNGGIGIANPSTPSNPLQLECREQLAPSPVQQSNRSGIDSVPLNGQQQRSLSAASSPYRQRCGSAASSVSADGIGRTRSDSQTLPSTSELGSTQSQLNPLLQSIQIQIQQQISSQNAANQANTSAIGINAPHEQISSRQVQANVWIPPKVEELRANLAMSNKSVGEVLTEMHNKSEEAEKNSSSPAGRGTHFAVAQHMNGLIANSSSSPVQQMQQLLPQSTQCSICGITTETSLELQVHIHADHVRIMDGSEYKCPKKHCGKLFPNRETMRAHIEAHYQKRHLEDERTAATPIGDQRTSPLSDATDSSCHSPATSSAAAGVDPSRVQNNDAARTLNGGANDNKTEGVCDAGFTSREALSLHSAQHTEHNVKVG